MGEARWGERYRDDNGVRDMTKYVEEIVNDIVRISGHDFDAVLDEVVSCGYLYVQ